MANPTGVVVSFQKNKKEVARLEDFDRLKLVGKGTFGKVFKV